MQNPVYAVYNKQEIPVVIKYLKDLKLGDYVPGTKKGKYIVANENTLSKWLEANVKK